MSSAGFCGEGGGRVRAHFGGQGMVGAGTRTSEEVPGGPGGVGVRASVAGGAKRQSPPAAAVEENSDGRIKSRSRF